MSDSVTGSLSNEECIYHGKDYAGRVFDRGRLLGIVYGLVHMVTGRFFVKIRRSYHEYCYPFSGEIAKSMVIVKLRGSVFKMPGAKW